MTNTDAEAFLPEPYLLKLVTIHTYIDCLARSPRLRRHFFNKEFTVVTVCQPRVPVSMPEARDWEKVVEDALKLSNLLDYSNSKLRSLFETLKSQPGYLRAPVHCECALITHYQNRPNSKSVVAPLEYIGVSKLSCKACVLFFEASNKVASSRFCTRGLHQKWYFTWVMPKCGPEIRDEFASHLVKYLANALQVRGIARRRYSDSSAGTMESDGESEEDPSDPEELEKLRLIKARLKA